MTEGGFEDTFRSSPIHRGPLSPKPEVRAFSSQPESPRFPKPDFKEFAMANVFKLIEDENGNLDRYGRAESNDQSCSGAVHYHVLAGGRFLPRRHQRYLYWRYSKYRSGSRGEGTFREHHSRMVPAIVWRVVEVGTDGTTPQTLSTVSQPDPANPRFTTAITIIGQKG